MDLHEVRKGDEGMTEGKTIEEQLRELGLEFAPLPFYGFKEVTGDIEPRSEGRLTMAFEAPMLVTRFIMSALDLVAVLEPDEALARVFLERLQFNAKVLTHAPLPASVFAAVVKGNELAYPIMGAVGNVLTFDFSNYTDSTLRVSVLLLGRQPKEAE